MSAKTKTSGRPKGGYMNSKGEKVPGTTTIIGRFKESGGLIMWAWKCGMEGIDINDARNKAADAGTLAHDMIDCHLHGREFNRNGHDAAVIAKADHAFLGFLEWKEQTSLKLVAAEVSMVSERHQFGGTFDAALVGDTLRLLDYKTGNAIYNDAITQVAGAYSILWNEAHPDQPLNGIDILRISKPEASDDPVSFHHCHWSAEIIPIAQEQFLLLRRAYDLDKRLKGFL